MRLKKHSDSETRVERDDEDVRGIMLIPLCEYNPSFFEFICHVLFLKHRNEFDFMVMVLLKWKFFLGSVKFKNIRNVLKKLLNEIFAKV